MKRMRLIGFTGPMGSGKSTAINYLGKLTAGAVKNLKFAQPLYDMQESIYDRIDAVYKRPDDFVKDRKLLQWLGTNWGRDTLSSTLWVDLWKFEAKKAATEADRTLVLTVDDVRFDNEAETIKELGGIIVRLETNRNDERIDTRSGLTNHASEAGVSQHLVDYMIENNGSIEEFQASLLPVFNTLRSRE